MNYPKRKTTDLFCKGDLGKEQVHVIVSSPMFQEGAEKMQIIMDDESLIVSE